MRRFIRHAAFLAAVAATPITLLACNPTAPIATPPTTPVGPGATPLSLTTVGGILVNSTIAVQLRDMQASAKTSGLILTGGGYRSGAAQIILRREHCGTSDYAIYQMPSSQCVPPTARPGTSLHESGLAIDFDRSSTHATAVYTWLAANAARFGFYNLPSEPWHWSVNGH